MPRRPNLLQKVVRLLRETFAGKGVIEAKGRSGHGGEIARAGARISGAAAGGYLSAVMGPEAGAGAGQALSELGESLVTYALEQRPRDRVLRVLRSTAEQVEERRAAGEHVRPEIADTESDEAAAVFEAVIDAAAHSFEERKAEAIANFYASVTFDSSVSIPDSLLYLRRIRNASWRQLVALCYFRDDGRNEERKLMDAPSTGAKPTSTHHSATNSPSCFWHSACSLPTTTVT